MAPPLFHLDLESFGRSNLLASPSSKSSPSRLGYLLLVHTLLLFVGSSSGRDPRSDHLRRSFVLSPRLDDSLPPWLQGVHSFCLGLLHTCPSLCSSSSYSALSFSPLSIGGRRNSVARSRPGCICGNRRSPQSTSLRYRLFRGPWVSSNGCVWIRRTMPKENGMLIVHGNEHYDKRDAGATRYATHPCWKESSFSLPRSQRTRADGGCVSRRG
jgi:hypothetical protein